MPHPSGSPSMTGGSADEGLIGGNSGGLLDPPAQSVLPPLPSDDPDNDSKQ